MLLASIAAPILFALGCAMLTAILLRRSHRYFGKTRRRTSNQPIDAQPRPTDAWTGAYSDITSRISRQQVELHEFERDASARIDSKLILLQQLVAQSQTQIDRLEMLLEWAEELQPQISADERE